MKKYALFLVLTCIVIFVLQITFPFITDQFALYSDRVYNEPWLLVTSMFLHGGFEHLFFNMFALGLFGMVLENIIGSRKFIFIYFLAGIIASVGSAIFYPASLGASGAIYGVLGTLTVLRPRMRVLLMGIPMTMYIAAIIWAGIDLLGMFAPSGTANAAHLFGLATGIITGFVLKSKFSQKKKLVVPLSKKDKKKIDKYFDRLNEFDM